MVIARHVRIIDILHMSNIYLLILGIEKIVI